MHDFFDIVGLSHSAPPVEVRRACARLIRRAHPDFQHSASGSDQTGASFSTTMPSLTRDVAVDFLEMSTVIDRIQSAFFLDDPVVPLRRR